MSVTREERSGFDLLRGNIVVPRAKQPDHAREPAGPAGPSGWQSGLSRSREATLEWMEVAERVGELVELDVSAHAHGAMLRRRGVPTATKLLCLTLLYGPGRMPLRMIAENAARLDIAHVSEPALLRRMANAAPWLAHVADHMLRHGMDRHAEQQPMTDWPGASREQADRRRHEVDMARAFIVDFAPWPVDAFNEQQVHWLLCVRWNYVAATLKEGSHLRPADKDPSPMERTRRLAHLIAASL